MWDRNFLRQEGVMVSSVTGFDPLNYLNQVKGTSKPAATTSGSGATGSANSSSSNSQPSSNVLGVSSNLLSLLQSVSPSSFGSGLLGNLIDSSSTSSHDPLSGVYGTLLYTESAAQPLADAIQGAQQAKNAAVTKRNPVQSILTSYHSAANAYNKTLQQHAKDVLKANNGQLPPA